MGITCLAIIFITVISINHSEILYYSNSSVRGKISKKQLKRKAIISFTLITITTTLTVTISIVNITQIN